MSQVRDETFEMRGEGSTGKARVFPGLAVLTPLLSGPFRTLKNYAGLWRVSFLQVLFICYYHAIRKNGENYEMLEGLSTHPNCLMIDKNHTS